MIHVCWANTKGYKILSTACCLFSAQQKLLWIPFDHPVTGLLAVALWIVGSETKFLVKHKDHMCKARHHTKKNSTFLLDSWLDIWTSWPCWQPYWHHWSRYCASAAYNLTHWRIHWCLWLTFDGPSGRRYKCPWQYLVVPYPSVSMLIPSGVETRAIRSRWPRKSRLVISLCLFKWCFRLSNCYEIRLQQTREMMVRWIWMVTTDTTRVHKMSRRWTKVQGDGILLGPLLRGRAKVGQRNKEQKRQVHFDPQSPP